jgi:hypothetical protein
MMLSVVAAALAVGCQTKKPVPAGPPPMDDASYSELRAAFEKARPGSLVGRVANVSPSEQAAEIVDIPTTSFKKGQVVLFIDAQQNALASGTVFNVTDNSVMVYYTPEEGGRAPVVGDAAVRLPVGR